MGKSKKSSVPRRGAKSGRSLGAPPGRAPERERSAATTDQRWTFLSNHAHVLICLARDSGLRLRDVAEQIGITERAVMKILADLEGGGLVRRFREGRRNSYELHLDQPLRHPIEQHCQVGELVRLITDAGA